MKNLSIKDLISFRGKSDRSKKTFVNNLKIKEKEKSADDSGGDYWISSVSTLSNSFKYNDTKYLNEKIEILYDKIEDTEEKRTRIMYQRNIDLLEAFNDFDLRDVRPPMELDFLKKSESQSLIDISGLPLKVRPNHVYSFGESDSERHEVGAIWYVAKLDGLNKMELGMFTDILYRYLDKYFSSTYDINPAYCISIDAIKKNKVSYQDINNGEVPLILNKTIKEIKNLL